MLVPQGMAYAMLAGLPPVMGIYASILPMIIYAFTGSSTTLSIGPVAIISMMVFSALQPLLPLALPPILKLPVSGDYGRNYFTYFRPVPFWLP